MSIYYQYKKKTSSTLRIIYLRCFVLRAFAYLQYYLASFGSAVEQPVTIIGKTLTAVLTKFNCERPEHIIRKKSTTLKFGQLRKESQLDVTLGYFSFSSCRFIELSPNRQKSEGS